MLIPALRPQSGPDANMLVGLMMRYQAADPAAAEELVERLSPMLLRFLSRPSYTRDRNEDLLQECWLQVHIARHTFRTDSPLLPWIFAIARYVRCKTYQCERRIRAREFSVESLPQGGGIPPQTIHLLGRGFAAVTEVLPESQREVLFLQNVLGMSVAEVAVKTSCTAGSVKQKAHRAYRTLRKLYAVGATEHV